MNLGPRARLNQALVRFEAKKPGTLTGVPQPRQIKWNPKEEVEGGVGSGTIQKAAPSSAPPLFPEIPRELDLENNPALMDAVWLLIINAKGSTDSA